MKRISFVKYNLIIAGVFFILALTLEWTIWDRNQMMKKLPVAVPIGLLLLVFLIFFSQADKEKDALSSALKGWRTCAISILVPWLLLIASFCLPEKYDKEVTTGFFIMLIFAIQYLIIAFIGKKYNVDEFDNIEDLISKNPGIEKWISKSALKRLEEKHGKKI